MEAQVAKAIGNEWRARIVEYLGQYPWSTLEDIKRGLQKRHDHIPAHNPMWVHVDKLRRAGVLKTRRMGRKPGTGASSYRHRYALSSLGAECHRFLTGKEPWQLPSEAS